MFEHAMTRTVTETDNVLFTTMTMNPQPLHLDAEFAKSTEFGRPLVNSIFTLGLVIGISVGDTTLGTTVANLGMTDVRFPKPVFHGDTMRVANDGDVAAAQPVAHAMPASSNSSMSASISAARQSRSAAAPR